MKKWIALVLAALLLSGCQLASSETRESEMEDKLVGVFVTFESLDLEFDIEGYLQDNPGALAGENEIVLEPGEGREYGERLWAEVTEDGWSFPDRKGLVMGQMWKGDHWAGFSSGEFCDMKTNVNRTDALDSIEEEGTIYVPWGTEVMLYSNPVFMTPDGRYYTVQGNSVHSTMEGGSMSQSVNNESTWTEGDAEYTYSAKYTTTIQGATLAESVVLVWMSADHRELRRAEYVPGHMPESLTPEADAAYLIVEEQTGDTVARTLCQPGDDGIRVYYQGDALWCLPQFTEILWSE